MRLEDKVAIVTGSAQGIGKTTAKRFAKEGAKVVICDVDLEKSKEVVEEIKEIGSEAIAKKVDVSDIDEAKDLVNSTVDEFGQLDILVNNAGITADSKLVDMSEEDFDKVINVNLKGTFNCGREAAKIMTEQDSGGVILNASSIVGKYGNFGQTNYAATKFGVIGMTKTWAKELGPKGVRVNAVAPGYTKTQMMESVPEKVLDKFRDKTPQGRLGDTEDIAEAYLYLASDEAKFVNGEVLSVDGGLILG